MKGVFILVFDFCVYIQLNDDEYRHIEHIYQVTYELTKKPKKNLFWDTGKSSKYHDMSRSCWESRTSRWGNGDGQRSIGMLIIIWSSSSHLLGQCH